VAQAWRKGHPSVELSKCFVCNESEKKGGGGAQSAIAEIAVIARDQKGKDETLPRIDADQRSGGHRPNGLEVFTACLESCVCSNECRVFRW